MPSRATNFRSDSVIPSRVIQLHLLTLSIDHTTPPTRSNLSRLGRRKNAKIIFVHERSRHRRARPQRSRERLERELGIPTSAKPERMPPVTMDNRSRDAAPLFFVELAADARRERPARRAKKYIRAREKMRFPCVARRQ